MGVGSSLEKGGDHNESDGNGFDCLIGRYGIYCFAFAAQIHPHMIISHKVLWQCR